MAKAVKTKPKVMTTKKHVAKKPAAAKKAASTKKVTSDQAFLDFRFTQETLHWVILGAVSIAFTLWIYTIDARIRNLYDQIDTGMNSSDTAQYHSS